MLIGFRHTLRVALLALTALGPAAPVFAVEPDEILQDAALEARARHISSGLRCLVCQNQSIDDSNAPLAKDLRVLVRDRLSKGDSDAAVLDFVVARYGAFVLLRPPVSTGTLLLWLTPLLLLGAAGIAVHRTYARSKSRNIPPAALSSEEQARLAKLLDQR